MYLISVISFLILGGFLLLTAMRFGIPDMVSDTYYQLQDTKGKHGFGWIFTLVMVTVAFLMAVCLLDSGEGVQHFAFMGCCGLAFVGVTPNYIDRTEGRVHKAAATLAAVCCTAWCVSVCPWPTAVIATLLALYLAVMQVCRALNGIWYISNSLKFHPWYWAEVAAFADVFATAWTMEIWKY